MNLPELLFVIGLILCIVGHYRWKLIHRSNIVYQFMEPKNEELYALNREHNIYNDMQNLFLDKDIIGT